MKIKNIVMIAAMAAATLGVNAQSLNVDNAIEGYNRKAWKKAKVAIDAAAVDERTKDDAKVWYYRALIYTRMGDDIKENPKSKVKEFADIWAEEAYLSALEYKRLDVNKNPDYIRNMVYVFDRVGFKYYEQSRALFNEKKYAESMQAASRAAEMYNNGGEGDNAAEAMYVAGLSATANHDTANVKKYFNALLRKKTDKDQVYTYLFNIYKAEGNVDQAMKIAANYKKNCKGNYKANLLMAEGYLLGKNVEEGKKEINAALELTKDSVNIYPTLLAQSAALLELTEDFAGAEAKYQESLTLKPVQFEANFNMGKMFYNRAVDKLTAADAVPLDDETGLNEKLQDEAKELFRRSISYLVKAVEFLDNLPADQKPYHRANLGSALSALATAYARVEMYEESKAANQRVMELSAE